MLCLWYKLYEGHKKPVDQVSTVEYKIDNAVLYKFNDGVIIEDRRAIPYKYLVIEGPSEDTDSAGLHEEGFFISKHGGGSITTFAADEQNASYCQLNDQGGYDIGGATLDQEVLEPFLRGGDMERSISVLFPRGL